MNENKFGCRPQKSTVDVALATKDFVLKSLEAGDVVALESLEVEGAFDGEWWPGIPRELRKCNCPKNLHKLTGNYFSQLTAVLSSNCIKVEKAINRGCPQGSACGPGFWNLQFNSLLGMQFMGRTNVIAYADYLLIVTRGDSVRAEENYANVELSKIERWSRRNKIKFNDKKSKVMLVTRRKRKEDKDITLYLHSKPQEQVRQMKYLGLILDQKFKFQEHIKYTTERCAKLTHNLSRVARLTWGLRYGAIATIYKGAILPLLSYGAPVWIEAMRHQHNRQKLKRVQRLINLRMARAFCTTSGEAVCILTGMKPIIIKIEEIVKQHEFKEWQPHREEYLDHDVEYRHWPHPATAVTIKEIDTPEESTISAYTDGSKSEEGVGAGVVIYYGSNTIASLKVKLGYRCSNNQAELLAIYKALEIINSLNKDRFNPQTAVIYTDSRVAIDSLHNINNHSYLAEETRKMIANLDRREWKIKFSWVKAHASIRGNETADRIAKEVARNTDMKCDFNKIPKSTIYRKAEEEAMQKWQRDWATSQNAAATGQYFPTIQHRARSKIKLTPKNDSSAYGPRDDEGVLAAVPPD